MQAMRILLAGAAALVLNGCSGISGFVARATYDPEARYVAPEGTQRLMTPANHNFRRGLLEAGDPVRRGEASERFELRDGDCGGSDCANPRARAELQLRKDAIEAEIGKDIWYGWSFFNASVPSFAKESSLRLVFGQWTMGGTNKPVFRFIQLGEGEANFEDCDPMVCNTGDAGRGDLVVQLSDIADASGWGDAQNDGYVCRVLDLSERQGEWADIMVNTNFSDGPDGYLRIWVDQRLVCNYSGPLVSQASLAADRPPGHRRGIYASWTNRWEKTYGDRPKPRLIVYYDEFRTGRQMSEVDIRQLEAAGVPPVD